MWLWPLDEQTMSVRTGLGKIVRLMTPPIVFKAFSYFTSSHAHDPVLEYAPDAWDMMTPGSGQATGWNAENVAETERAKWEAFCRNLERPGPLGFAHEHPDMSVTRHVPFHNVHMTYAYLLALTAHHKDEISVLDWGGALGHYYQIGRAVLPDVKIDFHCRELPKLAAAGRELNPDVQWHVDDSCLDRSYDLVMMNGSLQYFRNWQETMGRVSAAADQFFFLTRLPVVQHSPSFPARQRVYGTEMIHMQFNQDEVLQVAQRAGLELFREVVVGDRPHIHNAPEQCELRGWIFKAAKRPSTDK
jgi:putative methyltransferase (TIGR04325 family)